MSSNSSKSSTVVTEKDSAGRKLGTYTYTISDKSPNSGCAFKIPFKHAGAILSGSSIVNIYNSQQGLADIEARVEYGHAAVTVQPSVSWPGGVSISFNTTTMSMAHDTAQSN